jgi:hypothetical protein
MLLPRLAENAPCGGEGSALPTAPGSGVLFSAPESKVLFSVLESETLPAAL